MVFWKVSGGRTFRRDASSVASLDAITTKDERRGATVRIVGLDGASADRHERLTGHLHA